MTHTLHFIFPDDKYDVWLCKDIEWKFEEKYVIEQDVLNVYLTSFPHYQEYDYHEYDELVKFEFDGKVHYMYRSPPLGRQPFGHINLTRVKLAVAFLVPKDVETLSVWCNMCRPDDEKIVEKVQLIQTTQKDAAIKSLHCRENE